MRGCNLQFIQCYLDEFMWKHENNIQRSEAFNRIILESDDRLDEIDYALKNNLISSRTKRVALEIEREALTKLEQGQEGILNF